MPTALIVEDEPEANQLLAMLVQLRGYETDSAFTGREALALAEHRRPDVIFLDLMLPDTNGFEVCRSLKAEPSTAAIPVVMVTARLAPENRIEGFRAGALDYIPKPYTPDQIFQAMTDADSWRSALGCLDALAVPLLGVGDLDTMRTLARLRSAILARQVPTPDRAARLDSFLGGLAALVVRWPTPPGGAPESVLDYCRGSEGVTLTLRHLSLPPAADAALADLIAVASFDQVERQPSAEGLTLMLRMAVDPPESARRL